MAALSRISFRILAEDEDIKRGLAALGYKPLHSHKAISKLVREYAREIEKGIQETLKAELDKGNRFSVTTDEWTSLRNRRYCVVNVHLKGGKHYGIGMIRGKGKLNAPTIARIVKQKLVKFGLSPDIHIVVTTTDGATVMEAFGRLMAPSEHQLCYAHAIHLAVNDVVYQASYLLIISLMYPLNKANLSSLTLFKYIQFILSKPYIHLTLIT